MLVTAQQLFKDLEKGMRNPLCLVVGDEEFQANEILSRVKAHFLKDETDAEFNYEAWDGEHLDMGGLMGSLQTLPGLFGGDATRLVICRHFDKISPQAIESLLPYFESPSETTFFLMFASKADKRKAWYKALDERGLTIEVSEPYDREWPKWHGFFERRCGKKIDPGAWEMLVEGSARTLSLVWPEIQKAALFAADQPRITSEDVQRLCASSQGVDIFSFAEDVLNRSRSEAVRKFHDLVRNGESEIKMLSILLRQFRLVQQYMKLSKKGITDSKVIGPQIGISPYFVPKLGSQAKHHSLESFKWILPLLADCDYRLKTGDGGVFENFLVPYFRAMA